MIPTEKNKRFLALAKEQYGEEVEKIFDYSKAEFIRMKSPITVRCVKHGTSFKQRADTHLSGGIGCKSCRREAPKRKPVQSTADVIKLGTEIHKGLDSYEKTVYVNSATKITVTCKQHGDYDISIGSKIKIAEVHGERYEYDWDSYTNSSNKMRIKCPVHGWFKQRVNTHISGRGCYTCGVISRSHTPEYVLGRIIAHFRDRYNYDKFVYVRDGDPVILTCKKHGDFSKVPNELVRGYGCTLCKESKSERTMCNILDDNGIKYVQEYRLGGGRYHYDVYLHGLNVLIELDGKHHYEAIGFYGGAAGLASMQARDKKKDALAKEHDIPLIRIPYTEFGSLEKAFFRRLGKIYKYRIGNKFYKSSTDLPKKIKQCDVDRYLTDKGTQCPK